MRWVNGFLLGERGKGEKKEGEGEGKRERDRGEGEKLIDSVKTDYLQSRDYVMSINTVETK